MPALLIVGCASFDVLHFAGQTRHTIGGAGLYTALAAHRSGAEVTLLAPRPDLLAEEFRIVDKMIRWVGPQTPPQEMPRLEIAHHGGGRATLLGAAWGAEARLTPDLLDADLSQYSVIHIAALSSAKRQLEFLETCRARGANRISVGTYAKIVYGETETVRALFEEADLFFMNENEARGLFGNVASARTRSGRLLFVTRGERGAVVCEGDHSTEVAGVAAKELDPTGAGDTFCGAVLANLARGTHPVECARRAVRLAAQCIEAPGPEAIWNYP